MTKIRKTIEQIKAELRAEIESNVPRFKNAIIRELQLLYRDALKKNLSATDTEIFTMLVDDIVTRYSLPPGARALFASSLRQSEIKIAEVWAEYFGTSKAEFNRADVVKMLALYQVDFPKIQIEQRNMIVEEMRRAVRAEYDFAVIKKRLLKRGLGTGHAQTLTNTACAQFDNAAMIEHAKIAGIDKYLYDGVINPNSRPFCKIHCGKIYTLAELSAMDNKQGLPVTTSLGGYNCTHYLTPQV